MRATLLLMTALACAPSTSLELGGAPELVDAFYVQDPEHYGSDTLTEIWLTSFEDGCESFSRISSLLARGRVDEAATAWLEELPEDAAYFVASIRGNDLIDDGRFEGTSADSLPRESGQASGVLIEVTGAPDLSQGIPLVGGVTDGGSLSLDRVRDERITGTFETNLLGASAVATFDATWCRAVEEPRFRD